MLERAEQRFRVGVVVGHVRTGERRHHSQRLQGRDHRRAAHRVAVVGVDDQAARIELLGVADAAEQGSSEVSALPLLDRPPDDATAPHVHHQVEVQIPTADQGRQPRDVPAPYLVGAAGGVERARAGRRSALDRLRPSAQRVPLLDPIARRLRGQVQTLVGELGHELLGRKVAVPGAGHHGDELRLLGRRSMR